MYIMITTFVLTCCSQTLLPLRLQSVLWVCLSILQLNMDPNVTTSTITYWRNIDSGREKRVKQFPLIEDELLVVFLTHRRTFSC